MPDSCSIPSNPDIAGIGVRIAIYIQIILSFVPAIWALWDGRVSEYGLDVADGFSTTNLFLAFAILISCMVQATTGGLASYHASIILNLSWINNTTVFVYFFLYVQHKAQGTTGIQPKMSAWIAHIVGKSKQILQVSEGQHLLIRLFHAIESAFVLGSKARRGPRSVPANSAFRGLSKRITLVFGSIHLTLMAVLGIWLWSNPRSFGVDLDSRCSVELAELAILMVPVPFGKEVLRVFSLVLYSLFIIPGLNLLLPVVVFLCIYCLVHARISIEPSLPRTTHVLQNSPAHSESPVSQALPNHPNPQRRESGLMYRLAKFRQVIPVCIGLGVLLATDAIIIANIELTLRRNRHKQDRLRADESEWGFGQILAMILIFIPLRDLGEAIVRRRHEIQTKLNEELNRAISRRDPPEVSRWCQAGADRQILENALDEAIIASQLQVSVKMITYSLGVELKWGAINSDEMTPLEVATSAEDWRLVQDLIRAGVDVNAQFAERDYGAALDAACAKDSCDLDVIRLLLDKGALPDAKVALLLDHGADLNYKDSGGYTPLHYACDSGFSECTELLVRKGARHDLRSDTLGDTALHSACRRGRANCVRVFLEANVGIDAWHLQNKDRDTAVVLARTSQRHDWKESEIARLFRIYGVIPVVEEYEPPSTTNSSIWAKLY
ncbi:hypothetical protein NMY22_g545 [Coprinellus aureogranulatus]|nr:hypothetical protein NMY22_g545 [Coprinellus aureogranulatus]